MTNQVWTTEETTPSASAQEVAHAHQALFYGSHNEYVESVLHFVSPGIEAGDPVAVAVPPDKAALMQEHLNGGAAAVQFLDMYELGRNPARIIPAVQLMIHRHAGRTIHYVGEPIWPGRSAEEIREATRHEALINLAWPKTSIRVLCPYDLNGLDDAVLAAAERTHPNVLRRGQLTRSERFGGADIPPGFDEPLTAPPPSAILLTYGLEDLPRIRDLVQQQARVAGLSRQRRDDLVLAMTEVVTNTIRHAQSTGLLRIWRTPEHIVCQVEDPGHIEDRLVGRRPPLPGASGGFGLWMVNQLCDLVEVRSARGGTLIRLHSRRR